MKSIILILVVVLCGTTNGYTQTKTELQVKIDQQTKTIDSLNAVVANLNNIVETRDRTIKFLGMDKEDLNKIIEEKNGSIRKLSAEVTTLKGQTSTGTAKKVTLNNTRNSMTVPAGKHWLVNQFISDYLSPATTDSTGALVNGSEIFVFLKTLNNETLTDPAQGKYGPLLYSSLTPYQTILYPLIFTEGTTFSIVIYKGKIGELVGYEGGVVFSYWER